MVTVTGADFAAKINDSGLTATNAEYILDTTIDQLNLYADLELSNLQGTVGSKSLSVTSAQRGAIYFGARAIYASFWKNAANETGGIGALNSANSGDLMSNPVILSAIKEAALILQDLDYSRAII